MRTDDYIQFRNPNKCLVAWTLKTIINKRPLGDISSATGITVDELEDILNGRYNEPLKLDTIINIADVYENKTEMDILDMLILFNGMGKAQSDEERKRRVFEINNLYLSMFNVVCSDIFMRGYMTSVISDSDKSKIPWLFRRPKMHIYKVWNESDSFTWELILNTNRGVSSLIDSLNSVFTSDSDIRLFLQDTWAPDTMMADKTSIVYLDRSQYDRMYQIVKEYKINSDISLLLIDINEGCVIDACNLGKNNVFDTAMFFEQHVEYKNTGYYDNDPQSGSNVEDDFEFEFLDFE